MPGKASRHLGWLQYQSGRQQPVDSPAGEALNRPVTSQPKISNTLGEAHIGVVSVTPAHIAINDEQIMRSAEAGEVADLAVLSKRLMPDQNLHATCLVDEVDGASIAREAFARDIGKTPVENDDVLERGD